MTLSNTNPSREISSSHHQHLLCWRSVLAGLVISITGFVFFSALGAAVAGYGGQALTDANASATSLLSGAGLWLAGSTLISLSLGAFFAVRSSGFVTGAVGTAHGLLLGSIFYLLIFFGLGNALGGVAQGLGQMVKGAGNSVADVASVPQVQDAFNRAIGNAPLKSDAREVAKGLALRLSAGNVDSAKSYLAYQSGVDEKEVDERVEQLKVQFDDATREASIAAARGTGHAGTTVAALLLLGLLAASIGGSLGARANVSRPLTRAGLTVAAGIVAGRP